MLFSWRERSAGNEEIRQARSEASSKQGESRQSLLIDTGAAKTSSLGLERYLLVNADPTLDLYTWLVALSPALQAPPDMFALMRCLTGASSRCGAGPEQAGWPAFTGHFVDGAGTAGQGWAGSWVEGGDAALVGAPGLMANAKDALSEAVNEHAFLIDSGEPGLRSH